MRILVTGGAGFIGSHLCRSLLADGEEVICMDNFFTGHRKNVEALLDNHDFELLRHDVCTPLALEVDQIYHLACPASPIHYQRNPARTVQIGVQGTLNMLNLARDANARIFIASTSEVYGDPAVHPQVESYNGNVNPIGNRSCYDESKRCGETLAVSYAKQYNTQVRIARIFNTYGPYMGSGDGRVVSNFICQALREQPITIYGSGKQTRSFCFVSDLIKGIKKLMASSYSLPINIGNPIETTILELASRIIELTNSCSKLEHKDLPKDDPSVRCPDISLARKTLDWNPEVSLLAGLQTTIGYFRKVLG